MGLIFLQGLPQRALGQLRAADEFNFGHPNFRSLVDLEDDLDFAAAFFLGCVLDLGRSQALLHQQVLDRFLHPLQLGRAVGGIRQQDLVLFLELGRDVVFLDLSPGFIGDHPDHRIFLDGDLDDFAAGALILVERDVGKKAGRPEDTEILPEHRQVVDVPFPDGQVIHDRVPGDPVVSGDIDSLDHVLGESGERQEEGEDGENGSFHVHILGLIP